MTANSRGALIDKLGLVEFEAVICENCEEVRESGSGEPLYECGNCGAVFNKANGEGKGNKCPECKKFAAKKADDSCEDCEEGEIRPITVVTCPGCGSLVPSVELLEHYQLEHEDELDGAEEEDD